MSLCVSITQQVPLTWEDFPLEHTIHSIEGVCGRCKSPMRIPRYVTGIIPAYLDGILFISVLLKHATTKGPQDAQTPGRLIAEEGQVSTIVTCRMPLLH